MFILSLLKARTEELLYFLLWSAERLTRPGFRNLTESFESWAYRNGFLRELAMLEKQRLLERSLAATGAGRVYRLTAAGRLRALGGRDLEVEWSRPWDGRWRVVIFDIPLTYNNQRARLRRYLRDKGFGYLQNSVWIRPDPLDDEARLLGSAKVDVESLILLEARPCAGESNAEIVAGAWDFEHINTLYGRHLKILGERPAGNLKTKARAMALRQWAEAERVAWSEAVRSDPLLPRDLLPPGYLGRQAWQRRIQVLGKAKRNLRTFRP